jgi:hypothetical protein
LVTLFGFVRSHGFSCVRDVLFGRCVVGSVRREFAASKRECDFIYASEKVNVDLEWHV